MRLTRVTNNGLLDMLGIKVSKDCNLASAPDELFNVTGKVLIKLLIGEVTTVVATTTTLKLQRKTGTVDMCSATTITTDAVGTMYIYGGDAGAVLNAGDAPVVGFAHNAGAPINPIVFGLSGGSETIQSVLDGAGTGIIRFDLWYVPLEIGAKVEAAA